MEQSSNSEGDVLTNSKTQSIIKLRMVLVGGNPGKCQLFDMLPKCYCLYLISYHKSDKLSYIKKGGCNGKSSIRYSS